MDRPPSESFFRQPSRKSSRRLTIQSITANLSVKRIALEEHDRKSNSIAAFLHESVGEMFQQALPFKFLQRSERALVSVVGALFYTAVVACFCCLFAYSYLSYSGSPYISAEYDSRRCEKVGASITGTYIGGFDGVWRLESDYSNDKGLYKVTFDNFRVKDEAEFEAFVSGLDGFIAPIGSKMSNQTLVTNLLYLMTFREDIIHNGYKQTFTFTASPSAVFNMFRYHTQLAAYNATCGYSGAATGSKGKYHFEYKYYDYVHQHTDYDRFYDYNSTLYEANSYGYSTCSSIAPVTEDIITQRLDMESFTTALATNMGIMNDSYLSPIDEQYCKANRQVSYRGVIYYWFYSFHLRFPEAAAMKCLRRLSGDDSSFVNAFKTYCLIDYAGIYYGIPVLDNHGKYSSAENRYDRCTCPSADYDYDYYSYICQRFDFQGGIIFFPKADSRDDEWTSLLDVITGYSTDQLQQHGYTLSRHAFYKHWKERADFSLKYYDNDQSHFSNGYSLESSGAFTFCNDTCAVSAFNLYSNYDMYSSGRIISSSLYSLYNQSTACNNFIQSPSFSGLFTPPVPLTESYYSCRPTTAEALLFAMGAAQGTLQSLTLPTLLLVVAPLLYGVMYLFASLPQRQPFSERERQAVLSLLSEVVLEERDGVDSGVARESVLRRLSQELLAHAALLDLDHSDAKACLTQHAIPAQHALNSAMLYGSADTGAVAVEMCAGGARDSDSDEGGDTHDWQSRASGSDGGDSTM